jgi:hypothetical protein
MNGIVTLIEEIRTRTRTRKLNAEFLRAHFHKHCATHFALQVLPQLELFEHHLTSQRVRSSVERLYPIDENVLQASLTVKFGITVRVLLFRYDYATRDLSFVHTSGVDRGDRISCQSFVNFEKLTGDQIYNIIADFVSSVVSLE